MRWLATGIIAIALAGCGLQGQSGDGGDEPNNVNGATNASTNGSDASTNNGATSGAVHVEDTPPDDRNYDDLDPVCGVSSPDDYLGEYTILTDCTDSEGKAVVRVVDVWYDPDAPRPRAIDTVQPTTGPAIVGEVQFISGDEFWDRAYFFAHCGSPDSQPPGGIAFHLPSLDDHISCYGGVGRDQGESEPCVGVVDATTFDAVDCTLSAREGAQ